MVECFKQSDKVMVTFRQKDTYGYIAKEGKFRQINELGIFIEDNNGKTIFVPMFNISNAASI